MDINKKIQEFLSRKQKEKEEVQLQHEESKDILDTVVLSDFIGQEDSIALLEVMCARKTVLPHTLITGMPGMGKSLLARAIANETNSLYLKVMGGNLTNKQSLTPIISFLMVNHPFKVLFIDEIHSVSDKAGEELYDIMQHFRIGSTKIVPFCLIGATTYPGDIDDPLRTRFELPIQLQPYKIEHVQNILMDIAEDKLDAGIAEYIANRSKGIIRTANNLLSTVIRVAGSVEEITLDHARFVMVAQGIRDDGLNRNDIAILKCLSETPKPLSINTIQALTGVDSSEYRQLIEPILLNMRLIIVLPNGRAITAKGIQYLKSIDE